MPTAARRDEFHLAITTEDTHVIFIPYYNIGYTWVSGKFWFKWLNEVLT